jgi:DNA-binding transcriptional LysR family regulator
MDRLLTMRVLQTVVDEGGFAAAARALDMSPAAVTRCVADLEQDVGARLLQRSTRNVSLTPVGEAYLARVRSILADVDAARSAAREHTGGMAGVLRLCSDSVLATHVLAPLVAEFRLLHPAVHFDILLETGGGPPGGDFDVALFSAPAGFDGNVIARPFASTVGVLCASPDYLRRRAPPQAPQDLAGHDCLLGHCSSSRDGTVVLSHPEQGDAQVEVALRPVLTVKHPDTLLAAALHGAGIGFLSVDLAAQYLRGGSLVRVLAPWTCGRLTLYAMVPSRKFMPARTRAFMDFLSERMRSKIQQALHG